MSICLSFWILIQAIKLVPSLLIPFILRFNPYPPLFARLSGPISSVLTSWTILPSILIPLSYPSTCLTIGIRWILNFVPLCFANEDKGRSGEERIVLPKNRAISKFFFFLFFYRLQGGGGGFEKKRPTKKVFFCEHQGRFPFRLKQAPSLFFALFDSSSRHEFLNNGRFVSSLLFIYPPRWRINEGRVSFRRIVGRICLFPRFTPLVSI